MKITELMKKQVLLFDMRKKQSYVDRLMKEGELQGYTKLKEFYKKVLEAKYLVKEEKKKSFKDVETSMNNFDIYLFGSKNEADLYEIYATLNTKISSTSQDVVQLKARELVFADLDKDLMNSLNSLDILEELKTKKIPKDVSARIKNGLCALKRPGGKQKFICDNEVLEGSKYCEEHLIKYDPILYTELKAK